MGRKKAKGIYTQAERRKLSGATLLDIRTVVRWEQGEGVTAANVDSLERAARKLKLPLPAPAARPGQTAKKAAATAGDAS
jgi:hypothetical protein